jgi:hypothetical protein
MPAFPAGPSPTLPSVRSRNPVGGDLGDCLGGAIFEGKYWQGTRAQARVQDKPHSCLCHPAPMAQGGYWVTADA